MQPDPVLRVTPLGAPPWPTVDPFLFCVHHDDAFPAGNERFGPAVSLAGRALGQDFSGKDGFSMYHGEVVPGFPQHPHRGFETVTVVRRGLVDHADSLGAAARYGRGDVQWLTAGSGIVHAEMMPLLDAARPNPLDLFQIWLNLPRRDKFADPHFTMLWGERIPRATLLDGEGRRTELSVIAGAYAEHRPLAPPPSSWASRPEAEVAIWTLRMAPGAEVTLPPASAGVRRTLYFFVGDELSVGPRSVPPRSAVEVRADAAVTLRAGAVEVELLVLQGRPIGEPVAQHGPFVMNSREELAQAYSDYRRTGFGGWPWPSDGPVHGAEPERFARHVGGRLERPG